MTKRLTRQELDKSIREVLEEIELSNKKKMPGMLQTLIDRAKVKFGARSEEGET